MKVAIYLIIIFLPCFLMAQDAEKRSTPIKDKAVAIESDWVTFPQEYTSFQQYKDLVLVPEQISKAFKNDPVEPSKVVGDIVPYGETMHPILKVKGSHNGVDFRAVPGVAVSATADGIVELVKTDHEKYGQYIIIKHSDRTSSLYAHLSSIEVVDGQVVKGGQQIGAVGMSGRASYPHLHYELHVNNQTVNPILDTQQRAKPLQLVELKTNEKPAHATEKSKPLYVIDGIVQESSIEIERLRPDEIESLEVLKGEPAKAKYGELAKYGVVEINLKKTTNELPTEKSFGIKSQLVLEQNAPNPVRDYTKISFYLPSSRPASLLIYNQAGEFVYSLKDGFTKGYNEVTVSTSDLNATGLLYYFLIQDDMTQVKKMVVVQ